jgi:hypothetical protein
MSLASLIAPRRNSRFSFWFEHPVDFAHQLQQLVGILFNSSLFACASVSRSLLLCAMPGRLHGSVFFSRSVRRMNDN